MQIVTGIVIDGKVVLDGASLPEGASVTVFARETDVPVRLPGHLQSDLIGDEVQPLRLQMTATQHPQDWPATTQPRH